MTDRDEPDDLPEVPTICGTATATISRYAALEHAVSLLTIAARHEGDCLVVTLTVQSEDEAPQFHVHHSEQPDGGYPFLASHHDVWITPGKPVRLEFASSGRTGPWHLVFQDADAFVSRTVNTDER